MLPIYSQVWKTAPSALEISINLNVKKVDETISICKAVHKVVVHKVVQ